MYTVQPVQQYRHTVTMPKIKANFDPDYLEFALHTHPIFHSQKHTHIKIHSTKVKTKTNIERMFTICKNQTTLS